MWPFKENRRLDNLEEDFQRLKRAYQGLELEWEETLKRLKKAVGRIVKSEAIIASKEESNGEEPHPTLPEGTGPGGFLSPRQKLIQQQILRRRAGLQ